MKRKISVLIFVISFSAIAQERTLVKIPYKEREVVLRSMRRFLKSTEIMLSGLATNNFSKVEKAARSMLLNDDMLVRLGTRENDQFMDMALEFHTTGVTSIIAAARKKDSKATLKALSEFTARCNACHQTFKLIEWPEKDYPPPKTKVLIPPKTFNRNDWIKKEVSRKKNKPGA